MTDIELKVQKIELAEGDMLVLTFPGFLRADQVARIRAALSPILARKGISDGDILIIDGGAGLTVLRKSEAAGEVRIGAEN